MNSKITKRKLAIGLSYDWVKMIVMVVLIVFIWLLAYTVGAPRASVGQRFQLFVYQNFNTSKNAEDMVKQLGEEGVFSYDVLDLTSRTLTRDTYATIMSTVTFASEGDVMIVSNYSSEESPNTSHFKAFIDLYGTQVFDYEGLIASAKKYCLDSGLVYFDEENGVYKTNDSTIRSFFSSRMKKDPRFRNTQSEKYEQGVLDEIARIKLIWNNANMLEQCLEKHPELKTDYHRFEQYNVINEKEPNLDGYNEETVKTWGINLGALTGGQKSITELYWIDIKDDNGNLVGVSADNINICVFGYIYAQPDHAYEGIGVVNYFIKNYSNFFDMEFKNLIA